MHRKLFGKKTISRGMQKFILQGTKELFRLEGT